MKFLTIIIFLAQLAVTFFGNTVSNAINEFGFDLLRVIPKDSNLFFSPTSISVALTMTSVGADGETLQEMLNVLHISDLDEQSVLRNYKNLVDLLNQTTEDYELRFANALWAQKGYPFLEGFLKIVSQNFHAPVEQVDFVDNLQREQTRLKINEWISKITEGKIPQLISEDDINELTRLILTNAIYFKGKWLHQFDPSKIEKDIFHSLEGDVQVDMMRIKESFEYYEDESVQLAKLPYAGEKLYMLVVLPKQENGTQELEKKLNSELFESWINSTSSAVVDLSMPKFKFRNRLSLVKILQKLGMKLAFENLADFSRMTPRNDLKITQILHEAFIEVNEKGSEAAAATAVIMGIKMAPALQIVLKLDKPFLFFIVEKSQNLVLFMGRVAKP